MKVSTSIIFLISLLLVLIFASSFLQAQTVSDSLKTSLQEYSSYNQNEVYENHISYQKTVWRRISLKETQNQPFFRKDNEITKLIIDAVKLGIIQPYQNDSLTTSMSLEKFLQHIKYEEFDVSEEVVMMSCWTDFNRKNWSTEDSINWQNKINQESKIISTEYLPKQMYILETKTNTFFDKTHSRMIHDIQTISIILPAEMNPETGLEKVIATFSYKELVQNLFRDNSSAIYYNEKNNQAHRNLEEAFDLMLMNGRLIKYSNTKDNHIIDIYEDYNQALLMAQNYEATMIEYESNVWEN